jgi:hypothetical protein
MILRFFFLFPIQCTQHTDVYWVFDVFSRSHCHSVMIDEAQRIDEFKEKEQKY